MPTLDWIGKKAVMGHHLDVPFHLLETKAAEDLGNAKESGNLIVHGDNLIALKALLPYYSQKVKLIYIDPPYNTGQEKWIYNDAVNSPEIVQWLGKVVGDEASDLSRHDKWLCMMYPRLQLLKQFLRDDGVIMVSIDDFEHYRLRCIMDEIFGPGNFIAQLVWDKTRKNDAKLFSVGHEYILVYARSLSTLRSNGTVWREPKPGAREIMDQYRAWRRQYGDDDAAIEAQLREWYRSLPKTHPSKKLSRYKHVDKDGPWRDRDISWPGGGGPRYDVIHPVTGKPCKVPERGWGFATAEKMADQIRRGLVVFREDETEPPIRKAHLMPVPEELDEEAHEPQEDGEDQDIGLQVMPSVIYRQAQVAVKLLRKFFDGKTVFPNPKDHEVLMRLFRYVTGPDDIILDAFAGSASTAHAVLQLNKEDGTQRRFVLVEMDERVFTEVTVERVRRVVEGYTYTDKSGNRQSEPGLGGGAQVCRLGESLFGPDGRINPQVKFDELARYVFFAETGRPLSGESHASSPLIGVNDGTAIYLLYNGILGDKRPEAGNVLTPRVLEALPPHQGPKVVYGAAVLMDKDTLRERGIVFRQIPYELKVH
jgi:adenine-specific DNA-methyltransferase